MVRVDRIQPLHAINDEAKLAAIASSMRASGWQGRALLVYDCGDHYEALTGSHRFAAAELAELYEIPCLVIEESDLRLALDADDRAVDNITGATDDESREMALRDHGLIDAADLLAEEIRINWADYDAAHK
jgi:ParB-like chromosome segregation protein Spo0J